MLDEAGTLQRKEHIAPAVDCQQPNNGTFCKIHLRAIKCSAT
jgi:hypothetical protein